MMARETKTERMARESAELALYQEQFVIDYPERLLNLVYEYATLGSALGSDFRVKRDEPLFRFETDHSAYILPHKIYSYGTSVDDSLQCAEGEIESYLREEAERKRLANVRLEAKRKIAELLTDEERKVMGL